MEQQVLELLRASQLPAAEPRMAAEAQLKELYASEGFAVALVNIASHDNIQVADRQAALINLKNFVTATWDPLIEGYGGKALIDDFSKETIRNRLLQLVLGGNDSKIIASTAAIISKVVRSDFPEQWPNLLELLLRSIPGSDDQRVLGILKVLSELVSEGFDEEQFYHYGTDLMNSLREVSMDRNRGLMTRALGILVFRTCFDFVENLKDKDEEGIRTFSKNVVDQWSEFLLNVIKEPMPNFPTAEEEETDGSEVAKNWRGVVALKIQVILTLARIQGIFPDLMNAQDFFHSCWESIQSHSAPYYTSYVDGDRQGGLISQYNLHYTFDFLVIEEIDYLQSLLEAPQVKLQLDELLASDTQNNGNAVTEWISKVLGTLVSFSSITNEAEQMWEFDFNVFLSEETFAETTNSPRSVCAGFVWKLCNWFPLQTLRSLVGYMKVIFEDSGSTWRSKEAALFLLHQVMSEFDGDSRSTDPELLGLCVEYTRPTMNDEQLFLRARGHIAMSAILTEWKYVPGANTDMFLEYAHQSLHALENDQSDVVKTACIRIMRDYLTILPSPQATQLQIQVVNAIAKFLDTQDFDDMDENVDLVDVVLQTLRDTIMANPLTCLDHNALDVLLTMVKYGAARDHHSSLLIDEAFESAAEAMAAERGDAYARLCNKVLPSLVAALDVEDPSRAQNTTLTDVSASLLKILADSAIEPLPPGFIGHVMPRLCRLIFSDVDFYLRQTATITIKHMLTNDSATVFSYIDPTYQKNGLEMCFMVIGHLLGPQVDDNSAAEVGELAVSVVDQAGTTVLGNSMHELLQTIAIRLSTAEQLPLIQSLSMVFSRLALLSAADIITFLSSVQVGNTTGLAVVLSKWLENSCHFVGFEVIRQNSTALIAIHRLHDPRVASITVNGDLIPDTSSRIKTRSMAKSQPIRYTVVPANLKIIKVLVNELLPYGDPNNALKQSKLHFNPPFSPSKPSAGAGSDEEWESDEDDLEFNKGADDATQELIVQFFKQEGADPHFQELYGALTEEERKRCFDAVEGWDKMQSQKRELAGQQ